MVEIHFDLSPEDWERLQQPRTKAICRQAIRAAANRMRDKLVADLMDRARRNPPPAEWYDSPDDECPFDAHP